MPLSYRSGSGALIKVPFMKNDRLWVCMFCRVTIIYMHILLSFHLVYLQNSKVCSYVCYAFCTVNKALTS